MRCRFHSPGPLLCLWFCASVDFSTYAGTLETAPFRLLSSLLPGLLTHPAVAGALSTVLESPLLKAFENMLNTLVGALGNSSDKKNTRAGDRGYVPPSVVIDAS